MRALPTDNMRRFVLELTQPTRDGETNYTEAARRAGYTDGPALKVTAHRMAHDERIQAAILEETHRRLGAALPMATAAVVKVLATGKANEQLKAAEMIYNRAGVIVKTEHTVKVEKVMSNEEKVSHAIDLATKLGLDPKALLGKAGIQIEATPLPPVDPELLDFLK